MCVVCFYVPVYVAVFVFVFYVPVYVAVCVFVFLGASLCGCMRFLCACLCSCICVCVLPDTSELPNCSPSLHALLSSYL